MKPVYFPYTYLHPSVAESLRALFSSMAVYQPVADRLPDEMRSLAEEGFLEVIAPPPGDEEDFDGLMRDFQHWADLHQGGAGLKTALLHERPFSGPIGGNGSPAEIVTEIRRRLAPKTASKNSEATLTARVFLQLAQAADQLGHQISSDLARFEKAQARLFHALKGDADPSGAESGLWRRADRDDNGEDRLDLRTAAWARLFSCHPYPSPVFVTPGQAVIHHLAENVPGRLQISVGGLSPALQDLTCDKRLPAGNIMSQLLALAAAPLSLLDLLHDDAEEEPEGGRAQAPCVHLWPQIPPRRFIGPPLGKGPTESSLLPSQSPWRNTLVVQIR
jgi:hypothetical protein